MDRPLGWMVAPVLAASLWGGMYVVSKWGFDAIPPVTLAFARVALGAAVLLLVVRVRYPARAFARREWGRSRCSSSPNRSSARCWERRCWASVSARASSPGAS